MNKDVIAQVARAAGTACQGRLATPAPHFPLIAAMAKMAAAKQMEKEAAPNAQTLRTGAKWVGDLFRRRAPTAVQSAAGITKTRPSVARQATKGVVGTGALGLGGAYGLSQTSPDYVQDIAKYQQRMAQETEAHKNYLDQLKQQSEGAVSPNWWQKIRGYDPDELAAEAKQRYAAAQAAHEAGNYGDMASLRAKFQAAQGRLRGEGQRLGGLRTGLKDFFSGTSSPTNKAELQQQQREAARLYGVDYDAAMKPPEPAPPPAPPLQPGEKIQAGGGGGKSQATGYPMPETPEATGPDLRGYDKPSYFPRRPPIDRATGRPVQPMGHDWNIGAGTPFGQN